MTSCVGPLKFPCVQENDVRSPDCYLQYHEYSTDQLRGMLGCTSPNH